MVALVEVARRRRGIKSHNVPLEIVDNVHIFLVRLTGGSSTRAAEFPGAFDVDEGVEGRCRDRRASWIMYNLATCRIGAVTGMGITQRGGGHGPFLSAPAGESGLVFYNLSLSKARKRNKTDIVEGPAKEASPLSGHGQ